MGNNRQNSKAKLPKQTLCKSGRCC